MDTPLPSVNTPQQQQQQRPMEPSTHRKRRRLRRKNHARAVHTGGFGMDTIPEERTLHPREPRSAPLLLTPLLLMAATVSMSMGSMGEWKMDFFRWNREHRALITLTTEHVDQYPFSNFLEVGEDTPRGTDHMTGFYWQVPRSGGTTLKHIMGTCLRRVQAARTSSDYCDMNSNELSKCQTQLGTFVNADPSDHGGIRRADQLQIVPSGMVDVIVSSRILHASTLYDENHKGRLFTILREPIERSVSTFYYLQSAEWERNYRPEFKKMSLLQYSALPDTAHNWMVRWLTGKNSEPDLSRDDLDFAKELLRRKFLILLTDEMSSSVQRLLQYMHWGVEPQHFDETKQCLHENISKEQGHNKAKHPTPKKGSPEYEALRSINLLDIELYEFAKELFVEQWSTVYKGTGNKLNDLFLEDYEEVDETLEPALSEGSSQEEDPDSSTSEEMPSLALGAITDATEDEPEQSGSPHASSEESASLLSSTAMSMKEDITAPIEPTQSDDNLVEALKQNFVGGTSTQLGSGSELDAQISPMQEDVKGTTDPTPSDENLAEAPDQGLPADKPTQERSRPVVESAFRPNAEPEQTPSPSSQEAATATPGNSTETLHAEFRQFEHASQSSLHDALNPTPLRREGSSDTSTLAETAPSPQDAASTQVDTMVSPQVELPGLKEAR